jgi:ABC-type transport system involved in multi-copper enzyme maturation permease subunit
MNALVKKEIRLLLPSWLAVLALEVTLPWFWRDADISFGVTPVFIFLGMILLAVDSFGRECSLGTFQSLLAQPMERRHIWRTKISILFPAALLILAAYFISCELRLHLTLTDSQSIWSVNPKLVRTDFWNAMFGSGVAMLMALVGGLWTALLFRQAAAAFWISLLVPVGLFLLIALVMSRFFNTASDFAAFTVLYSAAGLYTIAGFWLAHRLFHRAQDVAWTGGLISFSKWRYFDAGERTSASARRRQPLSALLKKEFQLHSISLLGVGALLILHLAVFILRAFYGNSHKDSLTGVASEFFWILWLAIPLILGCLTVAEERKLGVAEMQFCLPVSRCRQFAGKFVPVMILGTLLGGGLPLLLETVASHLGAPNEIFRPDSHAGNGLGIPGIVMFEIGVVSLAAGLALVGFFASTLAKNFLQALSIAIVTILGCCLFTMFVFAGNSGENGEWQIWGMKFWGVILPLLIGILTAIIFLPWLAYRNFSHFVEGGRLWQRNIFSIVAALVFIFASSAAIYNRVWEIFEPAEPTHGTAVFGAANRPVLSRDSYTGLQVRFPDGRIWCDSLGYPFFDDQMSQLKWILARLVHPLPVSVGSEQFIMGSNWLSATARHVYFWNAGSAHGKVNGYLDTVGVQADGSLWISSEAKPVVWTGASMLRVGDETNWQQVVSTSVGQLLLKRNGTLWQWGTNRLDWNAWQTHWPTVRAFPLRQLGTNADWQKIFYNWNQGLARKNDGSVWSINGEWKIERKTNFDQMVLETFSGPYNNAISYIGKDGTLWANCNFYQDRTEGTHGVLQVGRETNWVATAVSWNWLVALKSDGSLWQWHFQRDSTGHFTETGLKIPPTHLGIHQDWIGLTDVWEGVVTLAADGSLWLWPNKESFEGAFLRAPKQPQPLGNVFRKVER